MGLFTKFTHNQLAGMRPLTDKAQLHTAHMVIAEQRRQIDELKRLVRYQQLHIARLRAGDEVEFPEGV